MAKKKEEAEVKAEEFNYEPVEGQVIEVEYDKDILKDFIDHKDEIIEGTGAEGDDVPLYGLQTTVNKDGLDELLGEGAEVLDE
ncbi:MAG: hypothetical protein IJH34_11515 [Romboutsia sp.]|nr:hypothetical protein [Romboutsia sp.]